MTEQEKIIIIDVRRSDEVFKKHFDTNFMKNFYNIPMNMIRFNKDNIISHLEYVSNIFIVCASGKRSGFIKKKYFSGEDRIRVAPSGLQFNNLMKGVNVVEIDGVSTKIHVDEAFSLIPYSMTRIVQIVLGLIMLICSSIILNKYPEKSPASYTLFAMGLFALYNGLTGSCLMSKIFMNSLN